ncbi:MAG: hypothetical protein QXR65_09105 [Candidatus Bathyarchaeia archaeon]|nr:hypothetical protein [Candidatus Bathyarchaeota archaeon]
MYRVEEKTFAGLFALTFLLGVFLITGMLVLRWLYTGEPQIMDYVKTFWAIIGPLLGAILTYYFKS